MARQSARRAAALAVCLVLVACTHSSSRGTMPRSGAPAPAASQGGLLAAIQQDLNAVGGALGPSYALARYGMPNPACWTMRSASEKVRRRLLGAIESGAGPDTQLCLAEYERLGTHEDLIFKVFVVSNPEPAGLVGAPYFVRKSEQLRTEGYPPIETAPHLLFYLTGSASNAATAWQIKPAWSARLRNFVR